MKKSFLFFLIGLIALGLAGIANATSLYVDSAPNIYGSPEWDPWWAATKADVANGSFVNMRSSVDSANVNTTNFDILDEVVYSFGNLGRRLHWIYWIPDTTVADLGSNFEISLTNIWDGDALDFYDYYYGSTWLVPTKWEDYAGGVIGSAGMAWWGAYNTNTQEELDADIASWQLAEETWIFSARMNGVETFTTQLDGVETTSITSFRAPVSPVPEPATMLLLGTGLAGVAGAARRRKKNQG